MTARWLGAALAVVVFALPVARGAEQDWVTRSNEHARVLLEVIARYNPEQASGIGVEGHESEVIDLEPGHVERQRQDLESAVARLTQARAGVTDPRVRQDVDILLQAARDSLTSLQLNRRLMLPYFDLPQLIFAGFQDLLDPRVPAERQRAAVTRLARYAGAEGAAAPITELMRARFAERAKEPGLTGPWIVEVRQHLENQDRYVEGMRKLFAESGLPGWERHFAALSRQLDDYAAWARETVIPRARQTHRLPPEIYADNLKNFGVHADPRELIDRALSAYAQTRDELAALARIVAEQRGYASADYRDVIRELKKERIPDDRLLALYRQRLAQLEDIVRRERIVTLPERDAVIRLATEAESAAQPAPHLDPPRLIGNTGEPAEFVLPLANPNAAPGAVMDDFIYDAIAWTLTAHEARPGHELQFARMLQQGVSTPRVVFAFNSANVEGWALYAEAVMKQYLPPEGQIGALQMRLMRAARAFLDPMLNLGLIEPEAAKRLLMEEVLLSEPMAKQEIDRYTFRAPGQATAYFYGYDRLETLRAKAELALQGRFAEQPFHDFIVDQGLLPLELLEQAVMETYVPGRKRAASAAPASTE